MFARRSRISVSNSSCDGPAASAASSASFLLRAVVKAANVENLSKLSWNGIAYGNFLSAIINFIIVGTTLFFVVKAANHAVALGKKEEATEEAAAPSQEELLAEIRDLLANK